MKVLIIGHGYVGSAVSSIFKSREKIIIDPKYFSTTLEEVANISFDIVFVCVDTPLHDKFNTLSNILYKLNKLFKKNTIVCCKSTAPPAIYSKFTKKYINLKIVHSPEFLSHKTNIKDFKTQKFVILGGYINACKKIKNILFKKLKYLKTIQVTDIETAALVKYSENAFLAYKITFFNELYSIHKKLKIPTSFNRFVDLLTLDDRIGKSCTQVPGPDGKKGWGGHCFTKDNLTFQSFTKSRLIEFIRQINKLHRSR